MIKIRRAVPNDAKAITTINVTTWKQAYKGLLPDNILAKRNVTEERIEKIKQAIKDKDKIYLVGEYDNNVVGFLIGGKPRDDFPFEYEIISFYVLPQYQKQGIGHALFNEFKKTINNSTFYLYVLEKNIRGISFYEKNGGKFEPAYTKPIPLENVDKKELLYSFK